MPTKAPQPPSFPGTGFSEVPDDPGQIPACTCGNIHPIVTQAGRVYAAGDTDLAARAARCTAGEMTDRLFARLDALAGEEWAGAVSRHGALHRQGLASILFLLQG